MHESLFTGPGSLRDPYERIAFWLTAICALPAALFIGFVLHESIGASQVALFIVIAMVYVTLARGRLVGSSVRVHEAQYPQVFALVKRACAALEIPMPLVFMREDKYVPVAALGFGEPYALLLSTDWIDDFEDDELAFMIGRELGHIAAGHTRFLSLLSVNGNENPLISLIFGAWLRRCTMTCDKIGLLVCGSLDAAIRGMCVAAFHEFGRKIDRQAFAEQYAELQADTVSQYGVWLGSEPYITTRIASLSKFIETHTYQAAEEWFLRERDEEPPAIAAPGTSTVTPQDCAGWWRRFTAYVIDFVVVSAIIASFGGQVFTNDSTPAGRHRAANSPIVISVNKSSPSPSASSSPSPVPSKRATAIGPAAPPRPTTEPTDTPEPEDTPEPAASPTTAPNVLWHFGRWGLTDEGPALRVGTNTWLPLTGDTFGQFVASLGIPFWLPIYMAALVLVTGQTFGMMITGLRVVTIDFRRPSVWQTLWRYAFVFLFWWAIAATSIFWRKVMLHDRVSKTRLVKVERVVARATGTN